MHDIPFNLLIGPLYNPGVLGAYRHHPRIRWFNSSPSGAADQAFVYDFPKTTFADFLTHLPLPGNWQPDILVWWDLIYQAVPPGIEDCPFPTAVIVGDWNIHFLPSRIYTGAFDYILGDRKLIQFLQQVGVTHCHYWPGFSFEPEKHKRLPSEVRIYDVTFVGNLNHRVQQERGTYLEKLAQLADRYRIQIVGGVYGEAYTRLLNQSKMVFNFSIRGEMNMRAYEAPACGALLLMEDSNLEVRDFLTDGISCVLYNRANLVDKIQYYLSHPDLLQQVASAGHAAIQSHSYEKQFEHLIPLLEPAFERFAAGIPRPFSALPIWQQQLTQIRQIYRANTPESTPVALRLTQTLSPSDPLPQQLDFGEAEMLNQLGKFLLDPFYLHLNSSDDTLREQARQYLCHSIYVFEHLSVCRPENPIVWFNLGVTRMAQDIAAGAIEAFNQAQTLLQKGVPLDWWFDIVQPQGFFQRFMVEWERRLALDILADQKSLPQSRALLLWQLHEYCGQIYQRQSRWAEANQAYAHALATLPDFGETAYYLAQTYLQLGAHAKALLAFEQAFAKQPFMVDAWAEYAALLLLQLGFAKAVAFLQQKLQVLTVNPALKTDEPQLVTLLRHAQVGLALSQGHSPRPWLLSEYNQTEFTLFQAWSKAVGTPETQAQWATLTCVWSPCWPEPRCLLEPATGWGFVEPETVYESPYFGIGAATADPPRHYHRSYHRPTDIAQGILGPERLPLFFPVSPMLEAIELDEQRPIQVLCLIHNWNTPALHQWLHAFEAGLGHHPDVACVLWNPWQPPNETELEQLSQSIQPDSLAAMVLLQEPLSMAQTYTLLQQSQIITGDPGTDIVWLLGWALYLGRPLWLSQIPRGLFPCLSDAQWKPFVGTVEPSSFAQWPQSFPDLQQQATRIQAHLHQFYQQEARTLLLNLLWELRLQRL